jgi:hypothetical protein
MIIGGSLYQNGYPVWSVPFVQDLVVVGHLFTECSFDGCLNTIFGHIDRLGVLNTPSEGRVGIGVGSAGFNGDHDLFSNAGKLLGHAVPAGEHGRFSDFKYASHMVGVKGCKNTAMKQKKNRLSEAVSHNDALASNRYEERNLLL